MKFIIKVIKNCYGLIITLLALPFALLFIVFGKIAIIAGTYSDVSLIASKFPFLFGQKIRYYYYKATLKHLGKNVVFMYGSFCQYPTAIIGDRVLFGYYNTIGEVNMGNDIIIGGFVNFLSGTKQHSFEDHSKPIANQKAIGRITISIGSDVWIGSNSAIAANVGTRCIIGMGSVVVKSTENGGVYGGNPAKLIKQI
jgi:acetyltransferase-like isoleucine patch superfamily enzyme